MGCVSRPPSWVCRLRKGLVIMLGGRSARASSPRSTTLCRITLSPFRAFRFDMAFSGFEATALEVALAKAATAPSEAGGLSAEPSLLEFAQYIKVPVATARALAEALGGGEDLTLEDFAFITEDAVKRAAETLVVDGAAATDLQKAQLNKLFHRARQSAAGAGLPVPGVIAPAVAPTVVAPAPVDQPLLLKHSSFIDQTSEATFPLLGPEVIRGLRNRYLSSGIILRRLAGPRMSSSVAWKPRSSRDACPMWISLSSALSTTTRHA